jgi:hypothetical protein
VHSIEQISNQEMIDSTSAAKMAMAAPRKSQSLSLRGMMPVNIMIEIPVKIKS